MIANSQTEIVAVSLPLPAIGQIVEVYGACIERRSDQVFTIRREGIRQTSVGKSSESAETAWIVAQNICRRQVGQPEIVLLCASCHQAPRVGPHRAECRACWNKYKNAGRKAGEVPTSRSKPRGVKAEDVFNRDRLREGIWKAEQLILKLGGDLADGSTTEQQAEMLQRLLGTPKLGKI